MIEWSENYSTGVASIDEQHQKLFKYVNELETAVKKENVDHAFLLRVLDFFEDYAKVHFGNEETCMYRFKCPIAKTNQDAHKRFIESYENFKWLLNSKGASYELFTALLSWSQEWLLDHICKIDTQLRPYVTKK